MKNDRIIRSVEVAALNGRKITPGQLAAYKHAVSQNVHNGYVEVMMLYFAEALHDIAGYGLKRTMRIIRAIDDRMMEFLDPEFSLNELRVRIFGKTGVMIAMTEADRKEIVEVLRAAGYKIADTEVERG